MVESGRRITLEDSPMIRRASQSAFSLIEMLVVISIITMLISFLLPSLSRAKESARMTKCGVQLRQLAIAVDSFSVDRNGDLPGARQGQADSWVQSPWTNVNSIKNGSLFNYTDGNVQAYQCPTFMRLYNPAVSGTAAFTYSMNEYIGSTWQNFPGVHRFEKIRNPSELMVLTDENWFVVPGESVVPINNGALGVGRYHDPGHLVDAIGSFHGDNQNMFEGGGLSNVAFFDQHVSLHRIGETKELATPLGVR